MCTAPELREILARELRVGDLFKAVIVIGPLGAAYFISGEDAVSDLSLIAISLLIAAFKLQLPPKLIALHLLVILVTLVTFFLAESIRPIFVLLAAFAAFLASALTRYGEALRTVGSWVFIPALYVACKLYENTPSEESFRQVSIIVAFAPVVLALVCAVQIYDRRILLAHTSQSYGRASSDWLLFASASAIAVFAAAALVEIFNLAQGQWLIWSAASVVVGDLATSTNKLKLRIIGASVGVPLGFLTGLCLPASRFGYSLAAIGALLTLVAFNRYVVGFGARCFFIALAAILAGSGSGIPEERVTNIFVGGAFGIIAVVLSELVWRRFAQKCAGQSEFDQPP
jgi:Fusaric acid resistance protein-like